MASKGVLLEFQDFFLSNKRTRISGVALLTVILYQREDLWWK